MKTINSRILSLILTVCMFLAGCTQAYTLADGQKIIVSTVSHQAFGYRVCHQALYGLLSSALAANGEMLTPRHLQNVQTTCVASVFGNESFLDGGSVQSDRESSEPESLLEGATF